MFKDIYQNPPIYTPDEIGKVIDEHFKDAPLVTTRRGKKFIQYYNVPCAFDIETTSTKDGEDERGYMYHWQLGLNGAVVLGRTWDEFINVMDAISEKLELCADKLLLIFVHNLAFEFQWIRQRFEWVTVFATDLRKPLKAVTTSGIEFRCSMRLSGYSLKKVGENLVTYKCRKMDGDLDYTLIRNSKTPLTEKERQYCINDVVVVMCYIQEQIEYNNGKITDIPLTNTGYVRRRCRQSCFGDNYRDRKQYENFMKSFPLREWEYTLLKKAYQGGFTHANAVKVGEIWHKVSSFDFTSSYPAVMVAERYPMGRGVVDKVHSVKELEALFDGYCVLIPIIYKNLKQRENVPDAIISESKCIIHGKRVVNNGRVVEAEELSTVITDVDFELIKKYYTFEGIKVGNVIKYVKWYLPTKFVKVIATLYAGKTTLKNVKGMEIEYQHKKGEINAMYGMCGTNVIRDLIEYDKQWEKEKPDEEESKSQIDEYNANRNRFLHYSWAVWVTAYARRNLLEGILACGDDYIYSDTDSIKLTNREKHMDYFNKYNKEITRKIEKACMVHCLPKDTFRPKTVKGIEKSLGVWDYEGDYERFKTLGAKRYMTEADGEVSLTVSGVNKKKTLPWLKEQCKNNTEMFNRFDFGLVVPADYSGKNTSVYIDDETTQKVTDYLGNTEIMHELSSVWLGASSYSMTISDAFESYLDSLITGVQRCERRAI